MVMTVECPACAATFPVDPAKVPEGGVKVRCSKCGEIFRVERPAPAEETMAFEAPVPEPEPFVAPQMPPLEDPTASTPPTDEWVFESEEAAPVEPEPMEPLADEGFTPGSFAEPEPDPVPAAPSPEPVQAFTFGKRDPTDKAKRLARVLVSDMIMYNAERHEQALANGTLKEDFEDEIEKSWKEYVEQVGEEMANANPTFWTDALNELLARGERVF